MFIRIEGIMAYQNLNIMDFITLLYRFISKVGGMIK